ncbi:hypothetical protein GJAV_G00243630 [Gymnothorax javanicus]|nr:hypothetical protein GJAV_G00243630 [Gymnothorax javanicus]
MAEEKEPPFFNQGSAGSFHLKLPSYEGMELLIETLTGTCFQLRASPFQTVLSVKTKIHRLEGIPVAQQHLIWNNEELDDEFCLHDYNIADGSALKLVLAMRGGPINTKRVAMDDSVKDMPEYVDDGRAESWEPAPPNKQVTYLVYREGDQLNVFQVVDRGDGTLTPVSESVRGGSVYNLYTEEEELGDSGSGQQSLENTITMSKMKLLKAKMENMNLNKKPKKSAHQNPRPPGGAPSRSSGGYLAPTRLHRPFRILPQIGSSSGPATRLPPARSPRSAARSSHLPVSPLLGPAPLRQIQSRQPEGEELWECLALGKIPTPPKVSRALKDRPLPPLSIPANRGSPDGAEEEPRPKMGGVTEMGDSALVDRRKSLPVGDQGPHPLSLDLSQEDSGGDLLAAQLPVTSPLPHGLSSDCTAPRELRGAQSASARIKLGPLRPSPTLTAAPNPAHRPSWPASFTLPSRSARHPRVPRADSPSAHPQAVPKTGPWGVPLAPAGKGGQLEGGMKRQEDMQPGTASNRSAGICSGSGRRGGTPTCVLPSVKAPVGTRKKSSKHCFLCRKRTGLATSFQCRCGNNFCATHRYAEAHNCSYDYKSAGRHLLQETNPLVAAPKLPKI